MAFAFSSFVVQLPLLVVMIVGFVLVGSRRARLGPRSTTFAFIGLALLTAELVLTTIWTMSFPSLVSSLDLEVSSFGLISAGVGLVLTALTAVGIALLLAALVSRPRDPFPPHYQPPAQ
ncbi:hypothetical protein AB0M54_00840 [Actinoplanes sp. NPDC051470]|uniref:hypothetical protein n=1 Tax=unclassified Actinoplanes TaxID=2626549 RepID=UPI003445F466